MDIVGDPAPCISHLIPFHARVYCTRGHRYAEAPTTFLHPSGQLLETDVPLLPLLMASQLPKLTRTTSETQLLFPF